MSVMIRTSEKPRRKQEATLQSDCTDLLALDGWRCIVTDPPWLRGLGVTEKGICDNLYLRYIPRDQGHPKSNIPSGVSETLWIEWKAPSGKTEPDQRKWHAAERARGALLWVALDPKPFGFEPTVEAFWDFYQKSGLCRQSITLGAR